MMPADYKTTLDVRDRTALYLIDKINCSKISKQLWTEIHNYSLLPNNITKSLKTESSSLQCSNIKSNSKSVESNYSSAEYNYNKYCENQFNVESAIVTLNQLTAAPSEGNRTNSESKFDSSSLGLHSYLVFDSGYDSESEYVANIIENIYQYLVNSAIKPDTRNSTCVRKSFCAIKKIATQEKVIAKLINLITTTIKTEPKNEKSATCDYRFKMIQEICKDNEIITMKTIPVLINEIVTCSKELIDDRSYNRLTRAFYLIETLKVILIDYKIHLNGSAKDQPQNNASVDKIPKEALLSSFKKLKKNCVENIKLLENHWLLSPILLSVQRCLLSVSDIIVLLQSSNR